MKIKKTQHPIFSNFVNYLQIFRSSYKNSKLTVGTLMRVNLKKTKVQNDRIAILAINSSNNSNTV